MNSNSPRSFVVTVLIVLLFASMAACAKKSVAPTEEETDVVKVEEVAGIEAEEEKEGMAAADEGMGSAELLDTEVIVEAEAKPLEGRTTPGLLPVYFDFDKSVIRSDQVARMEANAAFMKENPTVKIQIEGNCDERGTNEYNMALGQRRAMSGKNYLVNLGISERRISTISYGEERPINFGHDELSWSQNRRNDFVIIK
ncbi:MAG: peptidoglycan-associated lipoprotein Pal [Desulfurivibrionaceae bacterium]|nr:peptidoglycan-associated lipoprotein Pal [Desulfobulbales bacterium]MDT8336057.1 peptidoglycan-associated lipoprotein Pal [Desulfurivibrionaceae bacterium]